MLLNAVAIQGFDRAIYPLFTSFHHGMPGTPLPPLKAVEIIAKCNQMRHNRSCNTDFLSLSKKSEQ
jgi:hypothetical protein